IGKAPAWGRGAKTSAASPECKTSASARAAASTASGPAASTDTASITRNGAAVATLSWLPATRPSPWQAELLIDELLNLFAIKIEVVSEGRVCGVAEHCNGFGRSIGCQPWIRHIVRELCCEIRLGILLCLWRSGLLHLQPL